MDSAIWFIFVVFQWIENIITDNNLHGVIGKMVACRSGGPGSISGPAIPTISVEKLALFYNPAPGGTSQALQLHCIV
jgi:hypothetical protein